MSPPPEKMLRALAAEGLLTSVEAELAARLPVAEDITVEADSGGHTDNQALVALFPVIIMIRLQPHGLAEEMFGQSLQQESGKKAIQIAFMRDNHLWLGECRHRVQG